MTRCYEVFLTACSPSSALLTYSTFVITVTGKRFKVPRNDIQRSSFSVPIQITLQSYTFSRTPDCHYSCTKLKGNGSPLPPRSGRWSRVAQCECARVRASLTVRCGGSALPRRCALIPISVSRSFARPLYLLLQAKHCMAIKRIIAQSISETRYDKRVLSRLDSIHRVHQITL